VEDSVGNSGAVYTSLLVPKSLNEVTEIKIGKIKGNTKSKRISDVRKLYIKSFKKYPNS